MLLGVSGSWEDIDATSLPVELEPGPPSEKLTCMEGWEVNKGGINSVHRNIKVLYCAYMCKFLYIDRNINKDIHAYNGTLTGLKEAYEKQLKSSRFLHLPKDLSLNSSWIPNIMSY